MIRALFIFAKLNTGVRYVQGMNEVYAPLYYIFKTDRSQEASQNAEADAFFCFVELLAEFRDNFCKQLVGNCNLACLPVCLSICLSAWPLGGTALASRYVVLQACVCKC